MSSCQDVIMSFILFRLDDPPPSVSSTSTLTDSPGPFMSNHPDPFLTSVCDAKSAPPAPGCLGTVPPNQLDSQAGQWFYNQHPGSVGSSTDPYGSGSDAESDIDNCSASKLAEALDESQDLDVIAQVLYSHPTIQAVMANCERRSDQ